MQKNLLPSIAQVLSLVIYSCVSAAWYDGKCLFNRHSGICHFGSLALASFLACVALFIVEIFFGHISSLKVRRRIAIGDVIISGVNTLFYLLLFVFLSIAWVKSDYPPFGHSINCCRVAIILSFLAIFALAACTGLAYVRYQSGVDMSQFMTEDQILQQQEQYYADQTGGYQQPGGYSTNGGYVDPSQAYAQQQQASYMNYDGDINNMGQQ